MIGILSEHIISTIEAFGTKMKPARINDIKDQWVLKIIVHMIAMVLFRTHSCGIYMEPTLALIVLYVWFVASVV
jgi:hypothetical protein